MTSVKSEKMVGDELVKRVKEFHISEPDLGDSYSLFAGMRETCPVAHSEAFGGFWVLTQYEDIHAALKKPDVFSSRVHGIPPVEDERAKKIIPLNYDPPEHGMYRNQFTPYFAPVTIPLVEERARPRLRKLLEHFVAKGGGDFIAEVAVPFPCVTFLEITGLPAADLTELLEWKEAMVRDLHSGDPERLQHAVEVVIPKIHRYFGKKISERIDDPNPPDDVTTKVAYARYGDRDFTMDEKIRTLDMFFQAGLDTVTGLIGTIVEFLATHQDHLRQLQDDPDIIPNAIEEFLRYFGIITLYRQVMEDTVVHGVSMKAGDLVMMLTQSAGRDETAYENAEVVDFHRSPIRHLGLGGGPHRCLGSHLARMELRLAIEEICFVMPEFQIDLTEGIPTRHWGAVGGLDELRLRVG
jgi:cytochrome P450